MTGAGPLLFLIAGEPSGDVLGARLMAAARRQTGGRVRFAGIGGERMEAEGLQSLFPMAELSIMGMAEILPRLPGLWRRLRQTVAAVRDLRPAAVVTIDAPSFSFRVQRRLKGSGIPLIHYVAPSVWAWKPGRARKIARFLDHLLVLLPFEPPYFEKEGLATSFVGHAIVESGAAAGDGGRVRRKLGLAPECRVLVVLPGSRRGEVTRLLPVFGAAIARLAARDPAAFAVIMPVVPAVRDLVEAGVAGWPVPVFRVEGDADKYDAFAAGTAALAASGTVALELALARLPAVIAYRVHPLTAMVATLLVRVRYASLVNIMADDALVPELIQGQCTPERIAADLTPLIEDAEARQRQIDGVTTVARWLGTGAVAPSERAAAAVLRLAGRSGTAFPDDGKESP